MAVVYTTTIKNAPSQIVADAIDAAAAVPGKLEICTTAMATVLATITLGDPYG